MIRILTGLLILLETPPQLSAMEKKEDSLSYLSTSGSQPYRITAESIMTTLMEDLKSHDKGGEVIIKQWEHLTPQYIEYLVFFIQNKESYFRNSSAIQDLAKRNPLLGHSLLNTLFFSQFKDLRDKYTALQHPIEQANEYKQEWFRLNIGKYKGDVYSYEDAVREEKESRTLSSFLSCQNTQRWEHRQIYLHSLPSSDLLPQSQFFYELVSHYQTISPHLHFTTIWREMIDDLQLMFAVLIEKKELKAISNYLSLLNITRIPYPPSNPREKKALLNDLKFILEQDGEANVKLDQDSNTYQEKAKCLTHLSLNGEKEKWLVY